MSIREFWSQLQAARSASTTVGKSPVRGRVMPGGSIRYEPAELLDSDEVRELFEKLDSIPDLIEPPPPADEREGDGRG